MLSRMLASRTKPFIYGCARLSSLAHASVLPRVTVITTSGMKESLDHSGPNRLHTPGGQTPKHQLHLDLSETTFDEWPQLEAGVCSAIREVVARHADFDAVAISVEEDTLPTPEIWKALNGIQPTHLEMETGFDEDLYHQGLGLVLPAWPLKSLYRAGWYGTGEWKGYGQMPNPTFPSCYAGVETLVLTYASSNAMYFYPEGGATNLRSITIVENDAMATFAHTVACNPKTLDTIQSVTLSRGSCHENHAGDAQIMRSFFRGSRALVSLELAFQDGRWPEVEPTPYLRIYDYFPSSLSSLSFRAPRNIEMLGDIEKWIERVKNPAWLPNLRTFAFQLDTPAKVKTVESKAKSLTEGQDRELDRKLEGLLSVLVNQRPRVEYVQARSLKELEYPLGH